MNCGRVVHRIKLSCPDCWSANCQIPKASFPKACGLSTDDLKQKFLFLKKQLDGWWNIFMWLLTHANVDVFIRGGFLTELLRHLNELKWKNSNLQFGSWWHLHCKMVPHFIYWSHLKIPDMVLVKFQVCWKWAKNIIFKLHYYGHVTIQSITKLFLYFFLCQKVGDCFAVWKKCLPRSRGPDL